LKKIILIIFFPINSLFAYEVTCNFEEVYQNSEIQQGVFLIKDEMMRYQYYNQELFTIIAKNKKYFLVKNDTKIVQKLNEKTDVFDSLREIVLDFPKLKNTYKKNNLVIKIEKNIDQFIKRVSINSDEVNLSINVINCRFNEIEKKYFNHFNFVEYDG
tara:strand:- start:215 stop:688 length:474 start_codon:yes stop_codon:yes gene_type:complete